MNIQEEIARKLMKIWGTNDEALIDEIFSPDASYIGTEGNIFHGRAGAKQYIGHIHSFSSDVSVETKDIYVAENAAIVEWVYSGVQTGPIGGNVPVATGRAFSTRGVTVIEIIDNQISKATDYIDLATFLSHLGVGYSPPED